MSFTLQFDLEELRRSIADFERGLDAIRETLAVHGRGEVIAGRRRKASWETRNVRLGRTGTRTPSGADIANFLRAKNADPFKYPEDVRRPVQDDLDSVVRESIEDAYRTRRPHTESVRRAIIGAAMDLAEFARHRIVTGGLGTNSRKLARRKAILANMGRATRKYGSPPPYGVQTGRFVEAIRWRWRRGYRPGGAEAADPNDISGAITGRIV